MDIELKKKYVLGLIFDDKKNVLLINKLRPDNQKGKFNGIGGKVEKGETFLNAIIRETKEETNLDINAWYELDFIKFDDVEIALYYSIIKHEKIVGFKSLTDEKVELFNVYNLPNNIMEDIKIKINYLNKFINI